MISWDSVNLDDNNDEMEEKKSNPRRKNLMNGNQLNAKNCLISPKGIYGTNAFSLLVQATKRDAMTFVTWTQSTNFVCCRKKDYNIVLTFAFSVLENMDILFPEPGTFLLSFFVDLNVFSLFGTKTIIFSTYFFAIGDITFPRPSPLFTDGKFG